MSNQLPVAVINGIDKLGAKEVSILLGQNDIRVIGMGEYVSGLDELKNFNLRSSVEEIAVEADYWFDFNEDGDAWKKAEEGGSKLIIVGVNRLVKTKEMVSRLNNNWRIINVHGVYGERMDGENEETEEVEYLVRAIKLAVANKNLVLPPKKSRLRLLAVGDLGEAVLRASFLSGTEKEVFEIWGREIGSEEVAKVLIEEGKMTRFKVEEEAIKLEMPDDEEVLENWKKLRWQPEVELAEGMKKTMQYFFSKTDEENRKKKTAVIKVPEKKVEVEERKEKVEEENIKRYEVLVEKEGGPIAVPLIKEDIKAEVVREEEEVVIEREFEEIKPIIVHNSNSRPVANDNLQSSNFNLQKTEIKDNKTEEVKIPDKSESNKKVGIIMKITSLNWRRYGKWGLWWLGTLMLLLILIWGWENYQMLTVVGKIEKLVAAKKIPEAMEMVEKNLALAKKEDGVIESWGINRLTWGRRYQMVLKVVEEGLSLGSKAIDLNQKSEEINGAVFDDKVIDWDKELAELKKDLVEGSGNLGILQARLSGDWSWVPGLWRGKLTALKEQLGEMSTMASLGSRAVDLLPVILGTDGKKREFMVLLQNESELRAGGGFIGSWAMLSFEGGKLLNFEIKDIYEADGQLKGHVEPPLPIKNHLGEANWYMRDANWQADFTASAKDIQWFLEKETGRKVDGVIGVDLAVAKALLGVVGEVYVPDFKEKINKDNIYEQAEFYSETNSFPGSTQKASFLGSLGKQLFEGIKNLSAEKRWELIKSTMEMFEENEIQLALNEKVAAEVVADLGWDGAIYEGVCSQKSCFADYLFVVESNLGVNKANYFLRRSIDQMIDISQGAIGRVVKINYENIAKNNTWPGGDYKNYLRVYIPLSSNLAEVSVSYNNGRKTIISGNNLSIKRVGNKKEVGFLTIVPPGEKRVVELRYSDQVDLSTSNSFYYLDYIQKQPGFGNTPLATLVSVPEGWQPIGVEPLATMVNGKLLFSSSLDRDIKMGVEIRK